MRLLVRYLAMHLAVGYMLVACAFWALFGLFDFMHRVEEVGVAGFTVLDALMVTIMVMPARLIDLSPFIAMLGVVYGLSNLAQHNELIAMRNAGITPLRISALCLLVSSAFVGLFAVGELVARPLSQQAQIRFLQATAPEGALFSERGIWMAVEGGYLHIESLSHGMVPSGVYWYEFYPGGALRLLLHARRASVDRLGNWQLESVTQKRFSDLTDMGALQVHTQWDLTQTWAPPALHAPATYQLPMEALSLEQLYAHVEQRSALFGTRKQYDLEFWQRSLLPASTLALSLFAVPFVLGIGSRARMGAMVGLGVGAGFLLYLLEQMMSVGLYRVTELGLLSAGIPIGLALLLAVWLNYRVHRGLL